MVGQAGTVVDQDRGCRTRRQGQPKLRWQPHYPNWHVGFAEGLRSPTPSYAGGVRHRLPHARASARRRTPCRRRSSPAQRPRGGRADRVAARVPRHRGHPAVHRPAALGPRAARAAMSARGCPSRWSRPGRRPGPARAEMADSLSMAFLLLLERLSPEQRAAFLLREVFDYPYAEIARDRRHERGQRAPARLSARAAKVEEGRPRYEPSQGAARRAHPPLPGRHRGGRSGRPRGPAGRGRRAARRRRRQGPGPGANSL